MTNEAMEITSFYLKAGRTTEDFVAANSQVDAWLLRQPGFILRRVCRTEDGRVSDMLLWRSLKDGERAARRLMTELAASPVHAVIEQSTVTWTLSTCRHCVTSRSG